MARTMMLSPERVRRTIVRLAYEILESSKGGENLVILGILSGGIELAKALADHLPISDDGGKVSVHGLDVTPFRDDRDRNAVVGRLEESGGLHVADRHVVIVDDVLFTGRTARAAIDAVISLGRPKAIQLVVLVDRGHREFPIEPTFVGRAIKTKHKERVVVDVENGFAVYVEE